MVYTEFCAKVVAFILFYVYASCLLWAFSRETSAGIQLLNLKMVLGKVGSAIERLSLIDNINGSSFRDLTA